MIPVQIRTAGLLAVFILTAFFLVRSQMVPDSFGKYGHYRADALGEISSLPIAHAGEEACLGCHSGIDEIKTRSAHRPLRCEGCHGPSVEHASVPAENRPAAIGDTTRLCLTCHERNPTRPSDFPQIDPREHRPGIGCVGCHNPHMPERNSPWKAETKS